MGRAARKRRRKNRRRKMRKFTKALLDPREALNTTEKVLGGVGKTVGSVTDAVGVTKGAGWGGKEAVPTIDADAIFGPGGGQMAGMGQMAGAGGQPLPFSEAAQQQDIQRS